jgi:hypothetical protein
MLSGILSFLPKEDIMSLKTITFGIGPLGVALSVAAIPSNAIISLSFGWLLIITSFLMYTVILRSNESSHKIVIIKALRWLVAEILISNTANFAVAIELTQLPPSGVAINTLITLISLAVILLIQLELWFIGLKQPSDIH